MLERVRKPVWSKSGVKESRKSIDNSLPFNILLITKLCEFNFSNRVEYHHNFLKDKYTLDLNKN